jgi:flagellar hook-associated protein 3 FlgL
MRITFSTGQAATMADLEAAAAEMAKRQREVSSGKIMQAPSDDPSAWAASVRERGALSAVDQYVSAADSATSRLTVADTVLSDIVAKLTAARSAVVGGQGSTQTDAQREATAKDLEGLRDAVFDDLNTMFRGSYLFAGASSLTAPFAKNADGTITTYQGDASPISVDVDHSRAVAITFDGGAVAQGAAPEDVFATFAKVIAAVRAGDQQGMADGLKGLEVAFDRVVDAQGGNGANLNALDDQQARLSATKLASQSELSKIEDANMAESITAMQQANTAYQTALSAIATRTKLSLMDYLR